MARQALAVQARPMTLVALTAQIQAAVEPHGWTAAVVREGDSLVVDLVGAICPDPLLAMMTIEAELEASDQAGLEAIKLYGYCSEAETSGESEASASDAPGWMSVIDLDRYFSHRASLTPEAFGLTGAEASRLACEAERDRYAVVSTAANTTVTDASSNVDVPSVGPELEVELQASAVELTPIELDGADLELEDPWEMELQQAEAPWVPLSLDHFPRIDSPQETEVGLSPLVDPGEPVEPLLSAQRLEASELSRRLAGLEVSTGEQQPPYSMAAQPLKGKPASPTLAALTGYDLYRAFITEKSSWFAQTVKDDARLHALAKQRQHYTIGTLSHYLADTLAENERLIDLVPVRKRDRGCGLIFTDQRVISLSQPKRRDSSGSANSNRQGLEVWMVPWSWVHKVEISADALRFHYGRAKERFSVDLETPYHLRNAIPRDIPVRMVREIRSLPKQRAMKTKTGLAMVAGVTFALGSGFSLLNNVMNRQQVDARSNPLAVSRSAIQADSPSQAVSGAGQEAQEPSMPTSLVTTTNHEQCVNSFNNAAQPHAYATLNQVTQTLQVNLQNQVLLQMPQQQFDQTAAAVAQEILSSCQAKAINQVVVTNGLLRYQQQRPAGNVTSVKTEEALGLF